MDSFTAYTPMLPVWLLVPAQMIALALLAAALWTVRDIPGRFVVCAIWLRLNLSALHEYTFPPIFAGFSVNALASIAIVLVGLTLIDKRFLLLRYVVPIYIMIGAAVLSGAMSGLLSGTLDVVFKYLYFLVIVLAAYRSLTIDKRALGIGVLLAFAPLVVFQALSVVFNIAKVSRDGSLNYIGGYDHEASFSVALLGLFFISVLASGVKARYRVIGMLAAFVGILLANYRTTMIGMVPLGAYAVFAGIKHTFEPKLRTAVLVALFSAVVLLMIVGIATSERFADLGSFATGEVDLLRPPESLTREDRQVFTGRAYLWSLYLHAWANAEPMRQLVGFGPESWADYFTPALYAHNTFIGVLFDLGLVGEAALLFLMGSGLFLAARGASPLRMVTAHISFILINLATMPMWMIPGLITYGFVWAYTLYELEGARRAVPRWGLGGLPLAAEGREAAPRPLAAKDLAASSLSAVARPGVN